jgi:phosphate transport system substrate-binding protein
VIRAGVITGLLVLVLAAPATARTRTISMSGSSVAQAVLADLAYFYGRTLRQPPRFSFVKGGSGIGVADVERGIVDAGMVSRDLGPGDPAGLVLTPFALSGICLVTNRSNPVPGMTRALIQDIIGGRVTNWSQVPGSTRTDAIAPVALDAIGGAPQVFQDVFVDPATPIAYSPRTFVLAAQVRDYVARTPAAWGYLDLAFAQRVHALAYEGVPCERSTIRTGAYPARRPLGVVTRGRPRGPLARFLRWMARSGKARQVIGSRYIPVSAR